MVRPKWLVELQNERMKAVLAALEDGEITINEARAQAWLLKREGYWWQAMVIFRKIKEMRERDV
jgi:hypothetical protein